MMNNTQKYTQTQTKLSIQQILQKTWVREQAKPIVVMLILMFGLIRPLVVDAYRIPSGSMEETLLIGDRILVCKFIYGVKIPGTDIKVLDLHQPARGDVFVFVPPYEREVFYIKRIVAVEGDRVYTEGEVLYVNGQAVNDSAYTKHLTFNHFRRNFPPFRKPEYIPDNESYDDYTLTENQFRRKFPEGKPFVVPKGKVFAMGDNRDLSSDSRFWGPVSVDDIKGQAFMVMWSVADRPAKLWEVWKLVGNIRFNRTGKLITLESDFFKGN